MQALKDGLSAIWNLITYFISIKASPSFGVGIYFESKRLHIILGIIHLSFGEGFF